MTSLINDAIIDTRMVSLTNGTVDTLIFSLINYTLDTPLVDTISIFLLFETVLEIEVIWKPKIFNSQIDKSWSLFKVHKKSICRDDLTNEKANYLHPYCYQLN